MLGIGVSGEMMRQIGWNLREEAMSLPPVDDCPTSNHSIMMNIIIWNCREALKPSFLLNVIKLVSNHDPTILVVMETHLGGDNAKEVIDKLPFQGAIHMDTIGFVGGLWLLWDTNRVEISNLASTEQEVHAFVKVRSFSFNWILTIVYASLGLERDAFFGKI